MNQKEEEKLVMSLFRKNFPGFPKGRQLASESPDFIIKVGRHRSIGIELSRLATDQNTLMEKIKAALLKKTEKLVLYQKKVFNQIWLILYIDDQAHLLPEKVSEINIHMDQNRKFDRVFLFDLFTCKIFGININ